ncbi:MAG: penicillin-binding protein 2, partial [Anaerolineales bacterium]|nr:penicillin-binding protein 2 [Anaerolineales bacterium]
MSESNTWRYHLITFVFLGSAILIVFQLVRLQFLPETEAFLAQRDIYQGEWKTIFPPRGQIYDRWGNLLAGNSTVYEVGAELGRVKNPETVALAISSLVGADYETVFTAVSTPPSDDAVYVVLADFVSPEKVALLEEFTDNYESYLEVDETNPPSLDGLVFRPHLQRSYPEDELASNILGFVSREGRGYFGIEENFNDLLAGQPRRVWVPNNPNLVEEAPDIPPGASLVLTIDRAIQQEMEIILDRAIDNSGSEGGVIVVMNPDNGELLAMASTPRLNLNEYWSYGEVFQTAEPFSQGVSETYEPGSVFKVLTMAAALDKGVVSPETSFLDTGVFEIGGIYIRNWNQAAWGPQNMETCMQHSLNVCLAWVANEVGPKDYYNYLRDFGIGHQTGIDLAGEVSGRLKIPGDEDWFEADLGTNAFGQGVAVTPIQMVMAVSALANDGNMVVPHVLKSLINNGRQYDPPPQIAGRPISQQAAQEITNMLTKSLVNEASDALVEGYTVAGKTGTAEIPTPYGYTSTQTHASFVGWGPVDNPQFLVYVWL